MTDAHEVSRDQLYQEAREAQKRSDEWWQRWLLSLAVANGAALLFTLQAILSPAIKPLPDQTLPTSAWLFLVGLLAAGIIPRLRTAALDLLGQYDLRTTTETEENWNKQPYRETSDATVFPREALMFTCRVLELVSALAFAAGLAHPLWVHSSRVLF